MCCTVHAHNEECVAGAGTESQTTHGRPCGQSCCPQTLREPLVREASRDAGNRPPSKKRMAVLGRQAFSGGAGTVGMATRAWALLPRRGDTGPRVPTWLHVGVCWGAVKRTGVQALPSSVSPESLGMEPGTGNSSQLLGVLVCTPDQGTPLGGCSFPSRPSSPGWSTAQAETEDSGHRPLEEVPPRGSRTPAAQAPGSQSQAAWTEGSGLSLDSCG